MLKRHLTLIIKVDIVLRAPHRGEIAMEEMAKPPQLPTTTTQLLTMY
jgi:hypothetical protein